MIIGAVIAVELTELLSAVIAVGAVGLGLRRTPGCSGRTLRGLHIGLRLGRLAGRQRGLGRPRGALRWRTGRRSPCPHRHLGRLPGAFGLALLDLRQALRRTALAQLLIEQGALAAEALQALPPLGLDAIDAGGDGKLPRTSGLRGLGLAHDGCALACDALALRRLVVASPQWRHAPDEGQRQPQIT
jgi:hypothetical protein